MWYPDKLCKYVGNGEKCPDGKDCHYSHDLHHFDADWKPKKKKNAEGDGTRTPKKKKRGKVGKRVRKGRRKREKVGESGKGSRKVEESGKR